MLFDIYVLEGNLQWNSWICKMIGFASSQWETSLFNNGTFQSYLKGSISKFKPNYEKPLKDKPNQYDDDKYQVKHWCV